MKRTVISFCLSYIVMVAGAQQRLDVEAHRGGRGLMPENTIPAMLHAVDLGVRTLELDCVISADGQVVVSHDQYMSSDIMLKPDGSEIDRSEARQYVLYRMDYDSIRKFAEGVKTHPGFTGQVKVRTYKPLLSELVDSVESYVKRRHLKPVYYNMETKCGVSGDGVTHPAPERFVSLMMGVLKSKGILSRVIIQSFDPRTLRIVHRDYPSQMTALLVQNKDGFEKNVADLGFAPTVYSPEFVLVDEGMVKMAHGRNVKVLPWTVNEERDMEVMAGLGVDGIISDYPDRLVKLFGSYQ
ncbi:MAG: glycerophosphodiester phosphodiesterase [Bacteroidetes bacterium]|nr:glycerophosphodiester phosphodiesterase [Bacteroidota bacterium]